MKMRKNWKRFWTLNRHHAAGFTLVELIVVIAILAILGGVAVPAYSGYVKKANMGADQTMIRNVRQALELYYYSHPGEVTRACVIVNQEGTSPAFDSTIDPDGNGEKALEAAFGENWANNVYLKYDGWKAASISVAYSNSSYYGKENSLLTEVDKLTDALGLAVSTTPDIIGPNFEAFLGNYGLNKTSDPTAVGNAAVLYIAEKTKDKETEIQNVFKTSMNGTQMDLNATYNGLRATGMGDAAALAVIYAYAEGFAQYCDKNHPETDAANVFHSAADFSAVTDSTSAFEALNNAFNSLGSVAIAHAEEYMSTTSTTPGLDDLSGFINVMGTLNTNENVLNGNLASDTCFTDGTAESLLKGYASISKAGGVETQPGQVAVILTVEDGVVGTQILPIDWN